MINNKIKYENDGLPEIITVNYFKPYDDDGGFDITISGNEIYDCNNSILKQMKKSYGDVVYAVVNDNPVFVFNHDEPFFIYHFILNFIQYNCKFTIFECSSYEDAYKTFFYMHETNSLCYEDKVNSDKLKYEVFKRYLKTH